MTETYTDEDIPENVRELPVTSDPNLASEEKETNLTMDNRGDGVHYYTEIPTHLKWLQSISAATFEEIRLHDGQLVAAIAMVPKGIVKFQATARKSDTNSQMVAYGDQRGGE